MDEAGNWQVIMTTVYLRR